MSRHPEFSSDEVHRLTGATYRQLDYWDRTELICPAQGAFGSGTARRYSAADVVKVRAVVVLLAAGLSLGCIRRALESRRPVEALTEIAKQIEYAGGVLEPVA